MSYFFKGIDKFICVALVSHVLPVELSTDFLKIVLSQCSVFQQREEAILFIANMNSQILAVLSDDHDAGETGRISRVPPRPGSVLGKDRR